MRLDNISVEVKRRARAFLQNIYEKDVIIGVLITFLFILGLAGLLFVFPTVSGERWLLMIDVAIIAGLIAYLELDTIHAKREIADWLEKQKIPAKEKIFLKQALFSAVSMEEIAEVARTAILYQLSLSRSYPTPAVSASSASMQNLQNDLVLQLQREIEQLKQMIAEQRKTHIKCPHCGSEDTVVDSGYLFCLTCGKVSKLVQK